MHQVNSTNPLDTKCPRSIGLVSQFQRNTQTASELRERLLSDQTLRSLCGWSRPSDVPSESRFSRAFKEFSEAELPARIHASLIENGYQEQLVGHISRDSTAIEARAEEKEVWLCKTQAWASKEGGRTSKGGETTGTPAYQELDGDGR